MIRLTTWQSGPSCSNSKCLFECQAFILKYWFLDNLFYTLEIETNNEMGRKEKKREEKGTEKSYAQ